MKAILLLLDLPQVVSTKCSYIQWLVSSVNDLPGDKLL